MSDDLEVESFALTEHCRSVSLTRIIHPHMAQIIEHELSVVFTRLQFLLDINPHASFVLQLNRLA